MNLKPPCPRCEKQNSNGTGDKEALNALLSSLPEGERLNDESYARRLDICVKCEYNQNKTCELCGCYIEFRAAQGIKSCPDLPPRWKAESNKLFASVEPPPPIHIKQSPHE